MSNHEELTPEITAYKEISEWNSKLPHPVLDSEDTSQAVKKYPDGTQVIINRYKSVEHGGTEQELDTFSVNISHQEHGAHFELTQNGLVEVGIDRKTVSLRSHLYPRPTENLRVKYIDEGEEEKLRTPLKAFRDAAEPLVRWVREIDSTGQYRMPPVSIVEKL